MRYLGILVEERCVLARQGIKCVNEDGSSGFWTVDYSGVNLERRLSTEGVLVLFSNGDALLEEYYTAGILLRHGKHLLEQGNIVPMRTEEQFLSDCGRASVLGNRLFLLQVERRDRAILYQGSNPQLCRQICVETSWPKGSPLRILADALDVWWEFQQVQTAPYCVCLRFRPDADVERCREFGQHLSASMGLPLLSI